MTCSLTILLASSVSVMWVQGMFSGLSVLERLGTVLLLVSMGIIVYTAIVAALITREIFAAYYTAQIGVSAVGTRISEMQSLGKTTFEMVGGLHDVKQDLKESMIVPLLRPDISEQFGIEPAKGIMLFGPPGCGKTLLMKALATELHVEMINIKCSDIMSKWYGESEGRITELFKTAKERKPCIIFFDEIDAVAKKRELYSADDVTPRLLSIMLSELDGMDRSAGIIMVGSTNKPEMCDTALMRPGRFDKIMYVPPPSYDERIDIFRVHLQGKPITDDINLHELAKRTERFSGADIANLVKEAATLGMRRSMETGKFSIITNDDFMAILPRIRPSISLSMKEEYEKIKARYERKMHDLYRTEKRAAVSWEDVADLEAVKKELHEFIELPLKRHDIVEQYKLRTSKGLLLYGPPGCGKTYIMKAAANRFNIPMQVINTTELVNSLVSEGENAMREIFVKARDTAPSIVLFVELEMLLSRPEGNGASNASMREMFVQNQLVSAFDSLQSGDKVIIVATTDRPELISPEFIKPGRFEKLIYVMPPDRAVRKETFEVYLREVPRLGEIDFEMLADRTANFSPEDISNVVNEAKLLSIRDSFYTGAEETAAGYGVKMEDLVRAIEKTAPSISAEVVSRCERFRDTIGK
jgi:SpoVK/Ycf46/Vps4 family AAA+-type ATPase